MTTERDSDIFAAIGVVERIIAPRHSGETRPPMNTSERRVLRVLLEEFRALRALPVVESSGICQRPRDCEHASQGWCPRCEPIKR